MPRQSVAWNPDLVNVRFRHDDRIERLRKKGTALEINKANLDYFSADIIACPSPALGPTVLATLISGRAGIAIPLQSKENLLRVTAQVNNRLFLSPGPFWFAPRAYTCEVEQQTSQSVE